MRRFLKRNKAAVRTEELSEEDVWGVAEEDGSGAGHMRDEVEHGRDGAALSYQGRTGSNSSQLQFQKSGQKSAPVNVPDVRKGVVVRSESDGGQGEGEEEDVERLPPHEYLARHYQRSQTAFETVGRNAKGRDLNVRNAVWRRTGFSG